MTLGLGGVAGGGGRVVVGIRRFIVGRGGGRVEVGIRRTSIGGG